MLTKEQKEIRKKGIGGSDVAAILGISPWRTPLDVYLEKKGEANESRKTIPQEIGDMLEDPVRERYALEKGVEVVKPDANKPKFHDKYDFAFANVDGIINNRAILEIKTTNNFNGKEYGDEGTDQIPDYYRTQVAWYRNIYNADFCDIVVVIGNQEIREYKYVEDKEFEDHLFEKAYTFWHENVLKDNPPDPVDLKDIENLFPKENKDNFVYFEGVEELAYEYQRLNQQKKDLEEMIKNIRFQMTSQMKDAEGLVNFVGDKVATWKRPKPVKRMNVEQFRDDYPDLYDHYAEMRNTSRRFLITKGY